MTLESLHGIAEGRSASYWFLGGLFLTRPERPFLADLRARFTAWDGSEEVEAGLALVRDALDAAEGDGLADRLCVEYTRLFRGIRQGYGPAPPYESVHRESRLVGEATVDVTRAYAEAGFGAIDPGAGPQDHLGVELKFLSLLCHEEKGAWERGDRQAGRDWWRRQAGFLDRHLLAWAPAYCGALAQDSREPFYKGVALATGSHLGADRSLIDRLRETERGL